MDKEEFKVSSYKPKHEKITVPRRSIFGWIPGELWRSVAETRSSRNEVRWDERAKIGERGQSYARDLYDRRGQSSKSEETKRTERTVAAIGGSEETERTVAGGAWRRSPSGAESFVDSQVPQRSPSRSLDKVRNQHENGNMESWRERERAIEKRKKGEGGGLNTKEQESREREREREREAGEKEEEEEEQHKAEKSRREELRRGGGG
ncbi:hypothetical protein B296_00013731 [Ensete ventricosum]|uniref:Uncharacterized protein n=1 Tax=Ensete ventricosum TaxID=4639 RepID=A0A427B192_ENSVE|nr:hypothetical protein B296_00013731 [Ensete ventricosum]